VAHEDSLPDDLTGLRDRVEQILLGGRRRYTRLQAAERTGVPLERAAELWRSLGFADVGDEEVVFTDADLDTVRRAESLVEQGLVDPAMQASVSRMLGQTMSRLAEWQVHMLFTLIAERPELLASEKELARFVERLLPTLEQIQAYVWRRHLAAYAGRALASPAQELQSRTMVVGFADMVGYTSLTRRVSETELGRVLERFEAVAAQVVATHHGRIVKMLGDEVLFVADRPADGAEIALTLLDHAAADGDVPELRAGLAHGRVLSRFGDVYGPVVNIASRLTSTARPGTALVDRELATALREEPRFVLRPRRPVSVRGYPHLRPWALRRAVLP
jgi:adenylate cyclase